MNVAQKIASVCVALINCLEEMECGSVNYDVRKEWAIKHADMLVLIEQHVLPKGAGFWNTKIVSTDCSLRQIVIHTAFHWMEEGSYTHNGYYELTVRAALVGNFTIHVRGRDGYSANKYERDSIAEAFEPILSMEWKDSYLPIQRRDIDAFTMAYIEEAFALESYSVDGSSDNMRTFAAYGMEWNNIQQEGLRQIIAECRAFQEANKICLSEAGTDEQNGRDFYLTRNRHGAGYWCRDYAPECCTLLTTAAHNQGARSFVLVKNGFTNPERWEIIYTHG